MKNHLARIALTLVPAIFLCATGAGQAQTPSRIVFHNGVLIQKQHTTYQQLFSMNPDGSALTQLTSANASSITPAWSPGQQYIAFARSGALNIMEAKGETSGGRSFVVGPGAEPDWSPDGTSIVFRQTIRLPDGYHDDLYIVSVNVAAGTAGVPVFFAPSGFRPSWSPDGTKIAFKRYDSPTSANSTIIVRGVATGVEFSISGGVGYNDTPSWKPDGTHIAFASNSGATTSSEIYVANADGSNILRLTYLNAGGLGTLFPTWAPDSTAIAFRSDLSGTAAIYKMAFATGATTLVRQPGNAPDWAP
jgi:Tol biopolymer transport system component